MRTKHNVMTVMKNLSEVGKVRVLSELMTRSKLSSFLGMSFNGARDLYEVLGHKRTLTFQDYWDMFERGALGKRIVCAPVMSSWYGGVEISENEEPEETEFEKAYKDLNEKLFLIPKLVRLDILAGIGRYAVLLMGFSGDTRMDQPVTPGTNTQLLYVQPYHEDNAKIIEWEKDPTNERYGKPLIYQINTAPPGSTIEKTQTLRVHYSRVLHVADGLLENDVFGTPRLKNSFNRVMDLEKIVGGSAEMFWQGALGGKAFKTQKDASLDMEDQALQTEIDEYIHGLRRYMRLDGLDVENLAPQVSGPKEHIDAQIDIISGNEGIPKRILTGSEMGELASSQDEGNWNSRMQQRREQHLEPFMLRPFIDGLITLGVLPTPKDGYQCNWTPLSSMDETAKATVAKTLTEAIVAYANSQGAEMIIPEEVFLQEIINLSQEQIDRIKDVLEKEPPPTKAEQEIEYHDQLEAAGHEPEQRAARLTPPEPTGGKVTGKKPPVRNNEDLKENYNPNHDPHSGEFASGPGGAAQQAADATARAQAKERGYTVPPAWHHVQVSPDASAALQVKGIDSKGRTQYIYSKEASEAGAAQKFARLKQFTKDYPKMQERIETDMRSGHNMEEAKALYLISKTGFRIGGERNTGAEQQAYGASTLLGSHVSVSGNKVTFNFVGKKGVQQTHTIDDANVASWVRGKGPTDRLFNTTPDSVRGYLHSISEKDYKVKDFRTYVATSTAIQVMKGMPIPTSKTALTRSINSVAKVVSEKLGNTPAMAKNAYISPAVWAKWGV